MDAGLVKMDVVAGEMKVVVLEKRTLGVQVRRIRGEMTRILWGKINSGLRGSTRGEYVFVLVRVGSLGLSSIRHHWFPPEHQAICSVVRTSVRMIMLFDYYLQDY